MAAFVFNIAKGRVAHYGTLPATNDALIAVLLSVAEADDALNNYDDLAALLAGTSDEATFTGYSRQTLTGVTVTVNDTTNTVSVDADNVTWSPTSAQALVRILICYDPDTTGGTDSSIIPLVADDFAITTPTSGTVTYNVNAAGFFGAS